MSTKTTKKQVVQTSDAPSAIGTYSQAVKISSAQQTIYLSGQIPLVPETMTLISSAVEAQIEQVFKNLAAVCRASGGTLDDIVKLNIYLTNLSHFAKVNQIMAQHFTKPYPARAAVGVKELPKGALVEVDGILCLS